jgi:hypothetical protein
MGWQQFGFQWLTLTGVLALALWGGGYCWPQWRTDALLAWLGLLLFSIFTVLSYAIGWRAVYSVDKNKFIYIYINLIIIKLALCVALALAYRYWHPLTHPLFVLPFLSIYIIYTIFGTQLMMKLSKIKS